MLKKAWLVLVIQYYIKMTEKGPVFLLFMTYFTTFVPYIVSFYKKKVNLRIIKVKYQHIKVNRTDDDILEPKWTNTVEFQYCSWVIYAQHVEHIHRFKAQKTIRFIHLNQL